MSATTQSTALAHAPVPVLRITPPSRWWVVPFAELWDFRELIYFFVWRDIKIRYKQTAIGAAWAVLQPLLTMLVFSLFFGRLAHSAPTACLNLFFITARCCPGCTSPPRCKTATKTIVENQRLITKVYFPRLALPLSAVLSGLVDFGVSFLMFVVLMIYYQIQPDWRCCGFPLSCCWRSCSRWAWACGFPR